MKQGIQRESIPNNGWNNTSAQHYKETLHCNDINLTFALFVPPFPFDGASIRMPHERFGPAPYFGHYFGIARFDPFLISLVWLGVGIRQWFVLSKWTKRYERYKELEKN